MCAGNSTGADTIQPRAQVVGFNWDARLARESRQSENMGDP
jgi:hypothetical protein